MRTLRSVPRQRLRRPASRVAAVSTDSADVAAAKRLLDLATRVRKTRLLAPSGLPVIERVIGDALTVLRTVVTDWPT